MSVSNAHTNADTYPYANSYGDTDAYAWSGSGVWI
jgi:hypothetical protein